MLNEMTKVTKDDILKIKPGTSVTFKTDSYMQARSIKQYAYELMRAYPPEGIRRYKVGIDKETNYITITAIPI